MHNGARITINVAQSLNGLISADNGRRANISNPEDLRRVHMLRSGSDAIIVGANTIISDNPSLKVNEKLAGTGHNPARVVLDRMLRIPDYCNVLDGSTDTFVFTENREREIRGARKILKSGESLNVRSIVDHISWLGMKSLLVEGGANVIGQFLSEGIVDDFFLFVGNILLPDSGTRLFTPDVVIGDFIMERKNLGDGILLRIDPSMIMVKR